MAEEFYTPEEVAAILKLSKYTIYEMIKRGDLEAHRVGRGLRVSAAQLEQYLHQSKTDDNIFDAQLLQTDQGTYAKLQQERRAFSCVHQPDRFGAGQH